tara:strand:+ start:214 stop:1269 length:1056 start_codon:yes stop_codon:yes gene_type:complete
MQRILITGGAGYIGSHTCNILLEKGYKIDVIDSYINSSPESLNRVREKAIINNRRSVENFNVFKGDLRDASLLNKIFLDAEIEGLPIKGVIHFAGLKSVSESIDNPLMYWDCNVNSTLTLLKVMDKYNCRTIVFSSSATIYGFSNDDILDEKAPINPSNPYGRTKVAIEQLLSNTFESNKEEWKIANLRYFNPIGAHPLGFIGEDPLGVPNNIFPTITQVAKGRIKNLQIYGNDWPTADGTGVRDYIHVMDLAEGHLLTLEYLFREKSQKIYLNLGTGKGVSVLELINTFQDVNNVKVPYVFSSRRKGDSAKVVADNQLASCVLQWRPKRSIKDMCRDGWNWQNKNPNGYK